MMYFPNAISPQQAGHLLNTISVPLGRRRYERSHWDAAIAGFRELELPLQGDAASTIWSPQGLNALKHVKELIRETIHQDDPSADFTFLPQLHVSSVMRLQQCDTSTGKPMPGPHLDICLEPNSLYVMKDTARYKCTHEILAEDNMPHDGESCPPVRSRRISLIFRDALEK